MTQKAIKIKITMGNGGVKAKSGADSLDTPSADTVIRPNYQGISILLLIGAVIFGGSWLIFSADEAIEADATQVVVEQADPSINNKNAALTPGAVQDAVRVSVGEGATIQALASEDKTKKVQIDAEPKVNERVLASVPITQPVEIVAPIQVQAVAKSEELKKPNNSRVVRAQFTHGISKREPVDNVERFSLSALNTGSVKLYFFSELRNLKGKTIEHRWLYEDNEVAKVKFRVGGDRWRVYSSKNISADKEGTWSVVINDERGNELSRESLLTE